MANDIVMADKKQQALNAVITGTSIEEAKKVLSDASRVGEGELVLKAIDRLNKSMEIYAKLNNIGGYSKAKEVVKREDDKVLPTKADEILAELVNE